MNWTEVREFYGLKHPFNFNVAIPLLLNAFVLVVTLAACVFLFWNGGLHFGTVRFYFFSYIACLLLIAAAFSKISKLSYVILAWCTIELGLALGTLSLGLHEFNLLCPRDTYINTGYDLSVTYHPLLQSVPRPNWQYTDRLDFSGEEAKAKAAGIDVASLQGQKLNFVHNSLGHRGKELAADDLAKDLIFVYGGSTTYDASVTEGETWVEHLQANLNNKYTLVNFGVPAHSTAEHLIQTVFYQEVGGKKPVCAIYYIGWNDIANAHINNLDSAYADYHLLLIAERRPYLSLAKYSPLIFLANGLAAKRFDTIPFRPKILGQPTVAGPDEHLEAIFVEHIKTIAAINASRGVKTVFIGQIFNRRWLADEPEEFLPLVRPEEIGSLVERLKSILKSTAASIGAKYIDPGITNFDGNDFVDGVHFATSGSRKFATLVFKEVGDYCR